MLVPEAVVLGVSAPILFWSYAQLAQETQGTYLRNPHWLGFDKNTVAFVVLFQVLAAVGFLASVGTWVFAKPPQGGVLTYHRWVLPITLCVFMVGAIGWAQTLRRGYKWGVSASLVATALATVVLIAGAAEETNPRWWVVAGLLALGFVTVLVDGVMWNARWLSRNASTFRRQI